MTPGGDGQDPSATAIVARQAIVDEAQRLVGYELLYRGPRRPDGRPVSEADATSEVIWNAWMRLGRREAGGTVPIWLNVGAEYLLRTPALPVGPDDLVLELSERDPVTPELLERVRRLRAGGYRIALDDFTPGSDACRLLPFANVVKLDVLEHGVDGVVAVAAELRGHGVSVVAEKVETREDFARLRDAGLLFFQGYFYERPTELRTTRLPLRAVESLRAAQELLRAGEDLERIEAIVAEDAVLSFRLVRLANSGFYSGATPVDSLRGALTRVGSRAAREWLAMTLLHGLSAPNHPALLVGVSRARLCAALAGDTDPAVRDRCFLAGLFSVLDALIAPLPQLLAETRLDGRICGALLERTGREGAILDWAITLQRGTLPGALDPAAAADAAVRAEEYAAQVTAGMRGG